MAGTLVESLSASPPPSLRRAVRVAVQDPGFEPADVTVRRLSDQGVMNPDSILLVQGGGTGDSGPRSWTLVIKVIANQDAMGLPTDDLWYWKREALAFDSGLLDDLPAIRAPRCHLVEERDDATWIWMEHVIDVIPDWTEVDFDHAARAAGLFAGAYLAGRPSPREPWFVRDQAREWTEMGSPENAWSSPFVDQAFPPPLRARVMRLWDHRQRLFGWLARLPQTFSHGDLHRRNLMFERRADGTLGIVAVDWAQCGHAPVGGDLGKQLAINGVFGELELDDPARIDAMTDAYLTGLQEAGAPGHEDEARLGSALWLGFFGGLSSPAFTGFWTSDDMAARAERLYGHAPEELAQRWAKICEVALDRAEEGETLGRRLFG